MSLKMKRMRKKRRRKTRRGDAFDVGTKEGKRELEGLTMSLAMSSIILRGKIVLETPVRERKKRTAMNLLLLLLLLCWRKKAFAIVLTAVRLLTRPDELRTNPGELRLVLLHYVSFYQCLSYVL